MCAIYGKQEDTSMKDVDNVRVAVRCRPLNEKEVQQGCKMAVKVSLHNFKMAAKPW